MLPRTFVVGIGGTGGLALLALKELFAEASPNTPGSDQGGPSAGAVPPNVCLLAIDTASAERREGVAFDEQEFLRLTLPEPAKYLDSSASTHVHSWFPRASFSGLTVLHGAAQIRPLGRLALFEGVDGIVTRVDARLADLTERARLRETSTGGPIDNQGVIEVYIIASVCGGTGGALFLDVAALIRDALKNARVQLFGVFLLPGAFRGRPGTARVMPNAYAALKELDYVAGLGGGAPLSIDYGSRTLELKTSPFDLVYLVDSLGESYDTTISLAQLARQMAYLPFLMSSSEVGAKVRGVYSNALPAQLSSAPVHGKRAIYASFGVATIETPPHAVREARRRFQVDLFDTLISARVADSTLAEFSREARERLVVPSVAGWPELTIDRDPRAMSLADVEAAYHDRLADAADHARELADQAIADAVVPLRARIHRLQADAATRLGGLASARDDCRALSELLLSIRKALPDEQTETAGLAAAETEQKELWAKCQRAFRAFSRRGRAPAMQEWQAWVNAEVLPARALATARAALRSAIGALRDQVSDVQHWCDAALAAIAGAREDRAGVRIPVVPPPSPFSRYVEAGDLRVPPDAARFLRQTDVAAIVAPAHSHAAMVERLVDRAEAFADEAFADAIETGGHVSPTRALAAGHRDALDELHRFSTPLWNFRRTTATDQRISILGVDRRHAAAVPASARIDLAQTPWWDRVVHLQVRTGVPLFALTCMLDLWRAYSTAQDREPFHLDKRWTAWPEVLSHDFSRVGIDSFARAVAGGLMDVSGSDLRYRSASHSRSFGRRFGAAFETLCRQPELLADIEANTSTRLLPPGEAAGHRDALRARLDGERVAMDDRPLVEALCRRLDLLVDGDKWA